MRHRRRPARRPAVKALSVVTLLVATLATGRVLERLLPDEDDVARPFERIGAVGEPLQLRYGTVEIGRPDGSTRLDSGNSTYLTTGIYVAVPITFIAAHEPQAPAYVAIRDTEGRVFEAGSNRNPFTIGGQVQAGIPRHTQAAVELPVDAVPGALLVFALQPIDENHRRDDVAVIDLGLTEADAQEWAADDDGIRVEPAAEGLGERP